MLLWGISCQNRYEKQEELSLEIALDRYKPNNQKVLFLGIDALSWNVLEPLIQKGKMPNLKKLMDGGVSGVLYSELPIISPALWASMATGVTREFHGIHDFVQVDSGTGGHFVNSTNRKVKSIWNILTDFGLTVGMVGYFTTFPVEPVNGYMISDLYKAIPYVVGGERHRQHELIYPEDLSTELASLPESAVFTPQALAPKLYDYLESIASSKQLVEFSRPLKREAQLMLSNLQLEIIRLSLSRYLLGKFGQPDLFMFYMPGLDGISHFFWDFYQLEEKSVLTRKYEDLIPLYYEFADVVIGLLCDAVSSDTNIIIVSDHGFLGKGPKEIEVIDFQRLASECGFSRYMSTGEIDSEQSTLLFTGFFLGVASFKLQSELIPRIERTQLLQNIKDTFERIKTDKGASLFRQVNISDDIDTKDIQSTMADLFCEFDTSLKNIQQIILPDGLTFPIGHFIEKQFISYGTRDHELKGVIVAKGPDIRRGGQKIQTKCTILDITPTILSLFNLPVSQEFQGGVCSALLDSHFASTRKKWLIPSFGKRDITAQKKNISSEELEKLQLLGYIQN